MKLHFSGLICYVVIYLSLAFFNLAYSQINLVANPGFGGLVQCPTGYGAIALATGWNNAYYFQKYL